MVDGVVPGGGSSLVHCAQGLRNGSDISERTLGANLVGDALEEPMKAILANAGYEPGPILDQIRTSPNNLGFDVRADAIVDMWQVGVVDPVGVLESALKTAVHSAALLLTIDVLVHPVHLEKDPWTGKKPRLIGNKPKEVVASQ